MMKIIVVLISVCLFGCVSAEEQVFRDHKKCSSFGYTENNKVADCVKDLQIQREKKETITRIENDRWMRSQSSK